MDSVFSEFVSVELATLFETCVARRPCQTLRKGKKEDTGGRRPSEEHGCWTVIQKTSVKSGLPLYLERRFDVHNWGVRPLNPQFG